MVMWFIVMAVLGGAAILHNPQILNAINPCYGVALFVHEPWTAFVALGSVVLAVTGCEALYADMGHFGRRPIRWAWLYFALPRSGAELFWPGRAVVLSDPSALSTPFYALVPHWAHYPMVVAGDHGHHHRVAGGDLRRLLHHPPGRAARPVAAHGNQPHLGNGDGTDLCAARERDAGGRRGADRADLQDLGRSGRRLRHRGHRRDGDLHGPCVASWRCAAGAGARRS